MFGVHVFGVPFNMDRLFQLGKKHGIPIMEDCVQSGSLFGKYKGNPLSDVVIFSGGLDKTPQCFGAGLGFFRDSPNGNYLYEKCSAYHDSLPLDTWEARFVSCFNQLLHLALSQNTCFFNSLVGLIAYVVLMERGEAIKWYKLSIAIRKNKSFTPFQHAESGFLRRPSPYQLLSIRHGLLKKKQMSIASQREIEDRELLLSVIPSKYHRKLFPWYTPELLKRQRENFGIQEFCWVASPTPEERLEMMDFINDRFLITMINTTWSFHEFTKLPVAKDLNERLIYLPNNQHNSKRGIVRVGKVLTEYCELTEEKPKGQ